MSLNKETKPKPSEPGSNSYEEVLHTPQSSRSGALPFDAVLSDFWYIDPWRGGNSIKIVFPTTKHSKRWFLVCFVLVWFGLNAYQPV